MDVTKSLQLLVALVGFIKSQEYACLESVSCECRIERNHSKDADDVNIVVAFQGDFNQNLGNFSSYLTSKNIQFTFKNSSLTNIYVETFKSLNIKALTFQDQIVKISKDAFDLLGAPLRELSLINVSISRVWKLDFLRSLSELHSLVLDNNGIYPEHIANYIFSNYSLEMLKRLSLRNCKIVTISDDAFIGLRNLEELDLACNFLVVVPIAVGVLTNLRMLDLSLNKRLNYIRDHAFASLSRLEEINLSYSSLDTIAPDAFIGLENSLESIKIHHAELPDGHFATMRKLKKLHSLDISYNRIIEMHNTSFDGFIALTELDISGQIDRHNGNRLRLSFTDSIFRGIERKLKILRIRDLGLASLPLAPIASLETLQVLDASNNDFSEIYEGFFYGVKAQNIYMTDMNITDISQSAFETLRPGISLFLDRNNITNMSFLLKTPPCLFSKLSVLSNPIECDCDVVELVATNHVQELMGRCHNVPYKGHELQTLRELDIVQDECKPKQDKNATCSYVNKTATIVAYPPAICHILLIIVISLKHIT